MEDHGRPPAKPPWIKTMNPPIAMPQEHQHDLSKSKHHHDVKTSKSNNTSVDQKHQQTYMSEKPIQEYIREPTSSTNDNDTDAHG
eukprot:10372168-Ditylum_brightwellii.AAC.1